MQDWKISEMCCEYLTVQAQHHQHREEENGPQRGHGQLSDRLRIGQKSQTWT